MSSSAFKLFTSLMVLSMLSSPAAMAERLIFTPAVGGQGDGSISAQVPVKSIGSLALPNGMAFVSGHTIQVEAVPEWLFDRDLVLSGAVINSNVVAVGPTMTVSGLVYFNNGAWLPNLVKKYTRDTIVTTSGTTIVGNIQALMADGLEVLQLAGGRRKVLFTEIENIDSPRAYRFSANATAMKLDPATTPLAQDPHGPATSGSVTLTTQAPVAVIQGDVRSMTFTPANMVGRVAHNQKTSVPKSKLPGTEGGIPNSVIATQVLLDVAVNIIAPAVLTPILFSSPNGTAKRALAAARNRDAAADVSR